MKWIVLSFIALVMSISCCKSPQKSSLVQEVKNQAKLPELTKNPESFMGDTLEIAGRFKGYLASDCTFPENFCSRAPETRSDWVFNENGICIYVTGGKPAEFTALEVPETHPLIMLKARVSKNSGNLVYLTYISAQTIKLPLPKK